MFEDLEKFVVMDVFLKVALDDLKFSFSKILNLDFFGKRFDYYFVVSNSNTSISSEEILDPSKWLEDQPCIDTFIKEEG